MARSGLFGVLLASATLLVGPSHAGLHDEAAPLRVLFIGNSFTKSNDLPATVAALTTASGRELQYRTVAYSGFTLEDHWNLGTSRTALASREWDVVVMQDVPSSLPEDQAHLRTSLSRFAELARATDTRAALLTVWPALERRSSLPDVIASQRTAAQAAGANLIPAAEAVQAAWRCGLHMSLYSRDLVHRTILAPTRLPSSPTERFTARPSVCVASTRWVRVRERLGSCKPRLQERWAAGFLRAAAAVDAGALDAACLGRTFFATADWLRIPKRRHFSRSPPPRARSTPRGRLRRSLA